MILTDSKEKQMWEVFARTGDPKAYIRYSEYMKSISAGQSEMPATPISGKENGIAADVICRSDTVG